MLEGSALVSKKSAMLLCCLFLILNTLRSQESGKISGVLKTSDQNALPSASVALLKPKDSSLIKIAMADADGRFEFNALPAAGYLLKVTAIGYVDYMSGPVLITAEQPVQILPPFVLMQSAGSMLGEVNVTAKKPLIERKIDRTIVNVDAFISNAGANALEALEKSPGVQVDNNENISLNGKSSVLVYVDDKPTYLSGVELAAYLKSMPASSLDRIEIMTNPPARYDAEGNAGIINIRTRKTKVKGFNGSISAAYSQGAYPKTSNSVNFNYRNNKFNVFGTTSYTEASNFTDLDIERRIKNEDQSLKTVFAQNSFIRQRNRSNSLKLGIDYYVTQKSTIGVALNGMINPSTNNNLNISTLTDAYNKPDSTITADNRQRTKFRNTGINLNYRREMNHAGRGLVMDLDYINYNFRTTQFNRNVVYQPDNSISGQDDLAGYLPSGIDIYSYKLDYTHPLAGNASLEGGIKTSYTRTDNIAEYFRTVDAVTTPDYEITNHFNYKENINAAYAGLNQAFNRFSYQVGLRLEHTISKGNQLANITKPDSSFKRTYTNLFPTLYLSYKLDSSSRNQLTLSYGRRITRPYYRDLNPFVSPLDKFTFYVGNPFLQPQISDNIELSYVFNNKISVTAFHNMINKVISETIELLGTTYYSRPGNLNRKTESGLVLNGTFQPANWWTAVPTLMYIYLETKSPLYTEFVNAGGGFVDLSGINQFVLGKGWGAELNASYKSTINNGQFVLKAQWHMGAGVQKKIMKNKGSLKLSIRDAFYTRINYGIIRNLQNGEGKWRNAGDSRVVNLAFSYNFGKATESRKRHDNGGAQSEQDRVK